MQRPVAKALRRMVDLYFKKRIARSAAAFAFFFTLSLFPMLIILSVMLGSLNLDAGNIYQCTATGNGGGVCLTSGSFVMTGGTVSSGHAAAGGGMRGGRRERAEAGGRDRRGGGGRDDRAPQARHVRSGGHGLSSGGSTWGAHRCGTAAAGTPGTGVVVDAPARATRRSHPRRVRDGERCGVT